MTIDEIAEVIEYADNVVYDLSNEQLSLFIAYLQQLNIAKMS